MIAVEVKGRDLKFTCEFVSNYRAPNEDVSFKERLAARTGYTGNSTKRCVIGGDVNLPFVDGNRNAGCNNGTQAFINIYVWENGFTEVVDSPTLGNALLYVYLFRSESSFTASIIAQGISDHYVVIVEVEWEENCCVLQVEWFVPVYQKTEVLGLRTLLQDKFGI
jgi:hypothetical protein